MRVADRPLPAIVPHRPTGNSWVESWPFWPELAVEPASVPIVWDAGELWDEIDTTNAGRWGYTVWGGATWGGDYRWLWDETSSEVWPALTCDVVAATVNLGDPDEHRNFDAASILATIDNSTGRWSRYNLDGSLSEFGPGKHLACWVTDGTDSWWLLYARIARWDDIGGDLIEIEAFDAFSDLAQPIGTFTPGTAGDMPATRLAAIASIAGYNDRMRLALGQVHLTAQANEDSPLEEMQTVAASDGGVLFCDNDGTLVYADRSWRNGRADQTVVPVLSDNVCTADIIIWDAVWSSNDAGLADIVILENVAKLQARATSPTPSGKFVYSETDQQWTTQQEGDDLATYLVDTQPRVSLGDLTLYLFDPGQPTLWRAVDWRIGDRLRALHDQKVIGGTTRLDLITIINRITHDFTADGQWTMSVGTTKATNYFAPLGWDDTTYVWDDPNELAVWGY